MNTAGLSNNNPLSGRLNVARECLLLLVRRRRRFKVVNNSMQPTAKQGDHLLVNMRAYINDNPHVGDVVLAYHPQHVDLVITKRIDAVDGGHLQLASDNPSAGEDSRHFGPIRASSVLGRVTAVIR